MNNYDKNIANAHSTSLLVLGTLKNLLLHTYNFWNGYCQIVIFFFIIIIIFRLKTVMKKITYACEMLGFCLRMDQIWLWKIVRCEPDQLTPNWSGLCELNRLASSPPEAKIWVGPVTPFGQAPRQSDTNGKTNHNQTNMRLENNENEILR